MCHRNDDACVAWDREISQLPQRQASQQHSGPVDPTQNSVVGGAGATAVVGKQDGDKGKRCRIPDETNHQGKTVYKHKHTEEGDLVLMVFWDNECGDRFELEAHKMWDGEEDKEIFAKQWTDYCAKEGLSILSLCGKRDREGARKWREDMKAAREKAARKTKKNTRTGRRKRATSRMRKCDAERNKKVRNIVSRVGRG